MTPFKTRFNIISCNIRYDNPDDGRHQWKNRKKILAQTINTFRTDFLCTQEGRERQLRDLARSLKNLVLVDQHRRWIPVRMYPCIFVNPKTVQINGSGDIWLSHAPHMPGSFFPESTFPRLCTWMEGNFIHTKDAFFLVNVHLDHVLSETRLRQIKVLIREVKKMNYRNLPLILCGDFNESAFGQVRKTIENGFPHLYDPWFMLKKEEEASHHSFQGYQESGERIDWILMDHRIKCITLYFDKVSQNNLYPSDHYPLKGNFSF